MYLADCEPENNLLWLLIVRMDYSQISSLYIINNPLNLSLRTPFYGLTENSFESQKSVFRNSNRQTLFLFAIFPTLVITRNKPCQIKLERKNFAQFLGSFSIESSFRANQTWSNFCQRFTLRKKNFASIQHTFTQFFYRNHFSVFRGWV